MTEGREQVTGMGGVFFRSSDPEALTAWYREHLRVPASGDGYIVFPESRDTHWVPFAEETDYWPREKALMVNFTVRDLDAMLAQLRAAGVAVDDHVEEHEFGRFGWCNRSGGEPDRAVGACGLGRLRRRRLERTRPRA